MFYLFVRVLFFAVEDEVRMMPLHDYARSSLYKVTSRLQSAAFFNFQTILTTLSSVQFSSVSLLKASYQENR